MRAYKIVEHLNEIFVCLQNTAIEMVNSSPFAEKLMKCLEISQIMWREKYDSFGLYQIYVMRLGKASE